jgi:hypothetical protein
VESDRQPVTDPDRRWLEPISPDQLRPANLYEEQLKRRFEDGSHLSQK